MNAILLDAWNIYYNCSVRKKSIHTDYSTLTEDIEFGHKASKFIAGGRVRITKYKNAFSQSYTEVGQKKYLWLILC